MLCHKTNKLLPLAACDELDASQRELLDAHLDRCPACRGKLADLEATSALLAQGVESLGQPKLTPARRAAVFLTDIAEHAHAKEAGDKVAPKRRQPFWFPSRGISFRRLGAVAAVLFIGAVLAALLLPTLSAPRTTARKMTNSSQLRGIHQGMLFYAQSHDGKYQTTIAPLLEADYITREYIVSPQDTTQSPDGFDSWSRQKKANWLNENSSYVIIPSGEFTNDSEKVVGFEKPTQGKAGVSVIFDDNHEEFMPADEAKKLIRHQTGKSVDQLASDMAEGGAGTRFPFAQKTWELNSRGSILMFTSTTESEGDAPGGAPVNVPKAEQRDRFGRYANETIELSEASSSPKPLPEWIGANKSVSANGGDLGTVKSLEGMYRERLEALADETPSDVRADHRKMNMARWQHLPPQLSGRVSTDSKTDDFVEKLEFDGYSAPDSSLNTYAGKPVPMADRAIRMRPPREETRQGGGEGLSHWGKSFSYMSSTNGWPGSVNPYANLPNVPELDMAYGGQGAAGSGTDIANGLSSRQKEGRGGGGRGGITITERGVPLLDEIPFIQRLFKFETSDVDPASVQDGGITSNGGKSARRGIEDALISDIIIRRLGGKMQGRPGRGGYGGRSADVSGRRNDKTVIANGGSRRGPNWREEIGLDVDMQIGTDEPDDNWSPLKIAQDHFTIAGRQSTGLNGGFGSAVGNTGLEDFVVGTVGGSGRSLDNPSNLSPEAAETRSRAKAKNESQIQGLLQRALESQKKQEYDQALELLDQALFINKHEVAAQAMKTMIEDSKLYIQRVKTVRERELLISQHSVDNDAAMVPDTPLVNFPANWAEMTVRRRGLDEERTAEAEQNRRIETKLAEPIAVNTKNNTLIRVVEDLRNQTGLNFYVNWTQLENAGIEQDQPVSLQMANVPAAEALELILAEASAGDELNPITYTVHNGIVKISTDNELKRATVTTDAYDISDLLVRVPNFMDAPSLGMANSSSTDDDDDNDDSGPVSRTETVFNILDLIRQTGQPFEWFEFGGTISSVREMNGKLVIRTTSENHKEITRLLAMLREISKESEGELTFPGLKPSPPATAPITPPAPAAEAEHALAPAATFKAGPVNPFVMAAKDHLSTFALDVDTASYSLARNYIRQGYRPPPASVRMEEFVNAFDYNYPTRSDRAFAVHSAAAAAPFGKGLVLLGVGVKGKVIGRDMRKAAHLVFVIDTSGSMARADRLPLVQYGLKLLASQLTPGDRVSVVTYGTQASLLLEATPGAPGTPGGGQAQFVKTVEALQCQGSTNLSSGLALGYQVAVRNFEPGQINRVILLSDGVANIGATEADAILGHVESYRGHGITFTSVGFGGGSYNDVLLEKLANRGDGAYVFIDSHAEAKRVFGEQIIASLQTIAFDAKIQVEFNPQRVRRYRLIGYENRAIADKDFRNDSIDAGEVGSGQSSTALYELELFDTDRNKPADLGTVYVRYRDAQSRDIEEISQRLTGNMIKRRTPANSARFYLAACAAEFAEILRQSEHARGARLDRVEQMLHEVCRQLPLDTRAKELLDLVTSARGLPAAP
jgi:Ca-activated chloride channel family protein